MKSPRYHYSPSGCFGFSLLEVIVSVTIVAVLASMVTGVCSSIRTRMARADCTTRTRNLAHAGVLFFLDHERYPGEARGVDYAFEPYTTGLLTPYLGGPSGCNRLRGCPYSWMGGNLAYGVHFTRIDRSRSGYRQYGNKSFSVNDSHHWYRKDPGQFGFVNDQWGTMHFYRMP